MFRRITAFLLILILIFSFAGCAGNANEAKIVDLWYIEDAPAQALLGSAVDSYEKGTYEVLRLHAFPDEEALAEAMNNMRPDMLLCTSTQADLLAANGRLVSFLPLGYDTLLCCGEDVDDFKSLFSSGRRIYADSFSDVLCAALIQNSSDFNGNAESDLRNECYIKFYNIIADCAFSGNLVLNNSSCDVRFVRSSAASDMTELHVFPAAGSSDSIFAELYGIAVIEGGRGGFSKYLSALNISSMALSAGLIPISADGLAGQSELSSLLLRLCTDYRPVTPNSEYHKNRAEFEKYFRDEMSRVAGYR